VAASFLKIGGDLIANAILVEVKVRQELNQHSWCTVECRQTEDQRFPIEKCLGKDLQILTYGDDESEVTVFDGFIWHVELKYEVWGSYTARLVGVTRSYRMDLTPRKAYYPEKSLGAIASELAGNAGLQADAQHQELRPLNYVQWGETDFSFLNRLADDHGCWTRPSAKGIELHNDFQDTHPLEWRAEFGLIEFTSSGTLGQPSINGAHYNHHEMKSKIFEKVQEDATFFGSLGPLVDSVKAQSVSLQPDTCISAPGP
jgi:uncharacterized protein involved in type VI secretion and phage assembly